MVGGGSMTTFAPDARLFERFLSVPVHGLVDMGELARMAERATWVNRAVPRHHRIILVAGSGIPAALLRVPRNRSLPQIAISKDEIAEARRAGPDHVVKLLLFAF